MIVRFLLVTGPSYSGSFRWQSLVAAPSAVAPSVYLVQTHGTPVVQSTDPEGPSAAQRRDRISASVMHARPASSSASPAPRPRCDSRRRRPRWPLDAARASPRRARPRWELRRRPSPSSRS